MANGCHFGCKILDGNLRVEATFTRIDAIGALTSGRYEMPFPGTGMDASIGSALIQYYPKFFPKLGIQAGYMQVLNGRNVGISTVYSTALMYRFQFNSQAQKSHEIQYSSHRRIPINLLISCKKTRPHFFI